MNDKRQITYSIKKGDKFEKVETPLSVLLKRLETPLCEKKEVVVLGYCEEAGELQRTAITARIRPGQGCEAKLAAHMRGSREYAYFASEWHTPRNPDLALMLPLAEPVHFAQYESVARKVLEDLGLGIVDDASLSPRWEFTLPTVNSEIENVFLYHEGDPVLPHRVLQDYGFANDVAEWSISHKTAMQFKRESGQLLAEVENPAIRKFNEELSVADVIKLWLPDTFVPATSPDTFEFQGGSVRNSVAVYHKHAFSREPKDEHSHKLLSPFDLIRLHRCGGSADAVIKMLGEDFAGVSRQHVPGWPKGRDVEDREDLLHKRYFVIAELFRESAEPEAAHG